MTKKTWFLPPDFTFLPDGQIALGRIIPDPQRPTTTLASLTDHPTITLPEVRTIVEKNRSFSAEKTRSFGLGLLASFLDIASLNGKVDASWHKGKSFSAVDHEVQMYNGGFAPSTLKAIVGLEHVKRHIDSGRFGKRCVYVITRLRIAQQSFTVADERGRTTALSLEGSGPLAAAAAVPVGLGGSASVSKGDVRKDGYETGPGIVFAYRLHVIRPKVGWEEEELFSDRTGFCTGEGGEEVEEEEMEMVEAGEAVLRHDLDLEPDDYEERKIEDEEDSYVVYTRATEK